MSERLLFPFPSFCLICAWCTENCNPQNVFSMERPPNSLVITLYSSTFLWHFHWVVILVQCLGALPSSAELLKRSNSSENPLLLGSAEFQVELHRNHTKICSLTSEGGLPAPVVLESKPVFGLSLKHIKAVLGRPRHNVQ